MGAEGRASHFGKLLASIDIFENGFFEAGEVAGALERVNERKGTSLSRDWSPEDWNIFELRFKL